MHNFNFILFLFTVKSETFHITVVYKLYFKSTRQSYTIYIRSIGVYLSICSGNPPPKTRFVNRNQSCCHTSKPIHCKWMKWVFASRAHIYEHIYVGIINPSSEQKRLIFRCAYCPLQIQHSFPQKYIYVCLCVYIPYIGLPRRPLQNLGGDFKLACRRARALNTTRPSLSYIRADGRWALPDSSRPGAIYMLALSRIA